METVTLKAKKRDKTKKSAAKKYRREGMIPSIIYGQGENINIIINNKEFSRLSQKITRSTVINLEIEGDKPHEVFIQDFDKDYMNDQFVHVDFFELKKGKPVHTHIHLNFIGNPAGVREGGILEKHLVVLDVECLPKDIVSHFDLDIENLQIGDTLHVSDINLDKKYKVLSSSDEVVVHVSGKISEKTEAESVESEETEVEE